MELTRDQIDACLSDGYLKIPDVSAPAKMSILRADCYSIASSDRKRPDVNISELNSDSTRVSFRIDFDSKAVTAAVRVPRILGPVRRMLDEQIYLFQTRINAKMGRLGEGYPWHTDFANWINDGVQRGSINDMITVSILLTESTPENGALQVVPGSHRHGVGDLYFDTESVGYQSTMHPRHTWRECCQKRHPCSSKASPATLSCSRLKSCTGPKKTIRTSTACT